MIRFGCSFTEVNLMAEEVFPTEIRFSRELDPVRAVSLGLAILMATAIFTLHGPVMAAAGPAAVLSYLLMGGVFLLTLVCYVELRLSSEQEGGAYVLLLESVRGPWGFLTGWSILLGGLLLCVLLALGFAACLAAVAEAYFAVWLPEPLVAAFLILVIVGYNILGGRGFGPRRYLVTWAVIAALLLLCLFCLPHIRLENYRSFSPHGIPGVEAGLSLLLIGFLAFEFLPLRVSGILNPRQTIPWAFFAIVSLGTILSLFLSLIVAGSVSGLAWSQVKIPLAVAVQSCIGTYGQLLFLLMGLVFIPLTLNSTILIVVRQAQEMERDNLLPDVLRRRRGALQTPYLLLLSIGLGAVIFSLLGDLEFTARLGGFFALFLMSMIALAGIMRQRSPHDSPTFQLPLRPLIPALVLVISFFFLRALGGMPLLCGAAWMMAGVLIYRFYAKSRYIAAREGVVVFKGKREPAEAHYRVLVPLGPEERQPGLIELAAGLAGDQVGEVLPLRVVTPPEQVSLGEGERMAREVESLFSWSLAGEDTGAVSLVPITRIARSVSQGILDTAMEENCDLILLGWEGYTETKGPIPGPILDPVIENAPCDVLLVKGDTLTTLETILVPTSGGPHAPIAAEIALKLARLYGAQVTALYVCREGATAEERQHGLEMIAQTLRGLETDDLIKPKVITASGVVRGILAEAKRHDLMLLGASEESLFDRFIFGTVPERIARRSSVPVMIAKRRAPLPRFWLRRVWSTIYGLFPTLKTEERSAVYRQIREEARVDIDFFVMISLAAIIATLGLLLNSPAVIIGGMLVAPLMSPIIGIALAISLGSIRLLRDAVESTIKGIFLAVVIALFLTSISPLAGVNEEILARIRPNLLDLVVALASGAAGAYAVSRKDVSAALPGVAIAAALVPPLGVIGIGLATNRPEVAGGGLLLFSTNLVAITLAGAIIFLLLGFRPARGVRERAIHLRRGLVVSVLLLFVISLPLAFILGKAVQATQEREVINRVLNQELSNLEGVSLASFDFEHQGGAIVLTVTVYAAQEIQQETVGHLNNIITQAVGQPVTLRLTIIPVSEMEAS
jgi:APA family basic amino acid/polyamine antiporter